MAQSTQGENEQKQRQRTRKSKQTLTRAVPHIRLAEANAGKLEALDLLSEAFMALTQQYVTLFCTRAADPDGYLALSMQQRFLNAGSGLPFSRQRASPNRGAAIGPPPPLPISVLTQDGRRPKRRSQRPNAKSRCGRNGTCRNCG